MAARSSWLSTPPIPIDPDRRLLSAEREDDARLMTRLVKTEIRECGDGIGRTVHRQCSSRPGIRACQGAIRSTAPQRNNGDITRRLPRLTE
jgi:hypothetical protein